jgi:hypothetical protein
LILDPKILALLRLSDLERQAQFRRNIQGIRLRSKQDLEQVEVSVWEIFRSHQSVGLEEGYETLLAMLPGVANARHGDALKVRLLMEEKLAWFALPLGRVEAALAHARWAMVLALNAFRESAGKKGYLFRYGEAALVASVCLQKMHQPEQALAFIKVADDANLAAGAVPGSEHLRQRGTSFMHMGAAWDELARNQFERSPKRMLRKDEAQYEIDLRMTGLRQLSFLDPAWGWDKVQELAHDAMRMYGRDSLQYGVAAKSAALTGLKYGTKSATEASLNLLEEISPICSRQIHQGIPHILSITPELKLSPEDLDKWLRFAMNETPLSPRK